MFSNKQTNYFLLNLPAFALFLLMISLSIEISLFSSKSSLNHFMTYNNLLILLDGTTFILVITLNLSFALKTEFSELEKLNFSTNL